MALPLPLRNHLAELILAAFREPEARAVLDRLGRYCGEAGSGGRVADFPASFPMEFFDRREGRLVLKGTYRRFRDELCDRAGRACAVVRERSLSERNPSLREVLGEAAALFDARLHFEVHELLEPCWLRAERGEREILQGLIKVAVGYHHLATGNVSGARMLLKEGSDKLVARSLAGLDVGAFALGVRRSLEAVERLATQAPGAFDWSLMPRFPRESTRGTRPAPQ
ncbi:MAG: DUF309 domain-containing protein [Candidatus Methylomirabilia bacterium]